VDGETVGTGDVGQETAGSQARSGAQVCVRDKPLADWDGPQAQISTGLH
jgi:hypothetical protein